MKFPSSERCLFSIQSKCEAMNRLELSTRKVYIFFCKSETCRRGSRSFFRGKFSAKREMKSFVVYRFLPRRLSTIRFPFIRLFLSAALHGDYVPFMADLMHFHHSRNRFVSPITFLLLHLCFFSRCHSKKSRGKISSQC